MRTNNRFPEFKINCLAHRLLTVAWACAMLAFSNQAKATHAAGADLTYRCLGGLVYQVEASFYRDCGGSPEPGNVIISYKSASCGYARTILANKVALNNGNEITLPCASVSSTCNGGMSTGIKKWVYRAVVTLPAACTDWVFSYRVCCRNCTVSTIQNPCAANSEIYVEAKLNNIVAAENSSPIFSNMPIAFVCLGQNFNYNQGVYDIDGDSISYELITPKISPVAEVAWLPPSTTQSPLASSTPFTVNAITGDINFTPSSLQIGILAIRVNEFRNGQLIGSTIRDMQVYTQNCFNSIPVATGINGTSSYAANACAGQQICFTISAQDVDSNQTITFLPNNLIQGSTITQSQGGLPSLEFCWTPSQNDISTQPHLFTVTIRDNACPVNGVQTFSYAIYVNGPVVTTTTTQPTCEGVKNGSATAIINSAFPYTVAWNTNPVQTTITATELEAGNYTVTVTDTNGCLANSQVSLTSPPNTMSLNSISSGTITCQSGNNGSVQAVITGGTGPYAYLWNTGATTTQINGLGAGTYFVTVTDANGCFVTDSSIIATSAGTVAAQISNIQNVSCYNGNNGQLNISVSGGTQPYNFAWSNGASTEDLTNIPAGSYTVTISDANGCTASVSATINQPASVLQSTVSNVSGISCYGGQNGAIQLQVNGGTPPYSYNWNNGAVTQELMNLSAGTYTATVTDSSGCSVTQNVVISQPAVPLSILTTIASHVRCYGTSDGNIELTVQGGTQPYQYLWSNNATSQNLSGLGAGTYYVTVTDAHQCLTGDTIVITQPLLPLEPVISLSQVSDCIHTTSSLLLNVNGGTPPYSFLWNNGVASQNNQNLAPGVYAVTVTDANGCISTVSQQVAPGGSPVLAAISILDSIKCSGGNNGKLKAVGSGGTAPYSYLWNNGSVSSQLTGLASGTYTVTITDANGCTGNAITTVDEPEIITVDATVIGATCFQGIGGSVVLTVSGGKPGYQFMWSNGTQASQLNGALPGEYTVTVTDANNCSVIKSYTISDNSTFSIKSSGNTTICVGETITLWVDSIPGAAYQWYYNGNILNGATGMFFITPAAGTYYVGVSNACGSFVSDTIEVVVKSIENVSVSNTQIICPPETAQLLAFGGVSYEWTPATYITFTNIPDPIVSPINTTQYSVEIANEFGCKTTLTTEVAVVCDSLLVPTGFSPNNDGTNDGYVIDGIENYPGNKLWVYNRYGKLVYKAKDYANNWDGVGNITGVNMGVKVFSGTYYFILDLNDGSKPRAGYLIIRGDK